MGTDAVNDTAATVLGFLTFGPMSGWDIAARADVSTNHFWTVTRSQIYRELGSLAEAGFVEASDIESQATLYTITDEGREVLHQWLHAEPGTLRVREPFLIRLFFGMYLRPEALEDLVAVEKARTRRKLAEIQEKRLHLNPLTGAVLDYGIARYEAALKWFDETDWPALIEALSDSQPNPTRHGP